MGVEGTTSSTKRTRWTANDREPLSQTRMPVLARLLLALVWTGVSEFQPDPDSCFLATATVFQWDEKGMEEVHTVFQKEMPTMVQYQDNTFISSRKVKRSVLAGNTRVFSCSRKGRGFSFFRNVVYEAYVVVGVWFKVEKVRDGIFCGCGHVALIIREIGCACVGMGGLSIGRLTSGGGFSRGAGRGVVVGVLWVPMDGMGIPQCAHFVRDRLLLGREVEEDVWTLLADDSGKIFIEQQLAPRLSESFPKAHEKLHQSAAFNLRNIQSRTKKNHKEIKDLISSDAM
nr:hypothetical protein Iba_chr09cCG13840 [Ipomoea batatas]